MFLTPLTMLSFISLPHSSSLQPPCYPRWQAKCFHLFLQEPPPPSLTTTMSYTTPILSKVFPFPLSSFFCSPPPHYILHVSSPHLLPLLPPLLPCFCPEHVSTELLHPLSLPPPTNPSFLLTSLHLPYCPTILHGFV